jgi:hypothetical protein
MSMRWRSVAAVVAMILAGTAIGGVSGARPFSSGSFTAECGDDGSVTATPGKMWKPNHKMKTVTLVYEDTDDDGDALSLRIDSVTHDEEGLEKGATKRKEPDFVADTTTVATAQDDPGVTGPVRTFTLRKERLQKPKNGRTYLIGVTCTDQESAVGTPVVDTATVEVCIAHSRAAKHDCA